MFKLCVTMNKTIDFSSFGSLQEIKVVLNGEKVSEFCGMSDASLAHLTSVDIEVLPNEENVVDLSDMLIWASKRPIEKLHVINPVLQCAPLTVDAVLAWSRMSSLQELQWAYKPKTKPAHQPFQPPAQPFVRPPPGSDTWFDNLDQLPQNCWPKLESLKFHSRVITAKQLIMLLKSCPNVKNLDLGEPDHSLVLLLPEIGHICIDVESITLSSSRRREPIRVKLQEAFTSYPIETDTHISFSLLEHLHFDEELAPDVLHYLISQLADTTHLLSLSEKDFHEKFCHLRILLKEKLFSLVYLSWWERTLIDEVLPKKANSKKDFERDQNNNEILTPHGYKFREDLNDGLNGRDDFFLRLSGYVKEEDHQEFAKWDAGDYTWKMPECSRPMVIQFANHQMVVDLDDMDEEGDEIFDDDEEGDDDDENDDDDEDDQPDDDVDQLEE